MMQMGLTQAEVSRLAEMGFTDLHRNQESKRK